MNRQAGMTTNEFRCALGRGLHAYCIKNSQLWQCAVYRLSTRVVRVLYAELSLEANATLRESRAEPLSESDCV